MQLGMIGLGRMGASVVQRLMQGRHECVVFDMKAASVNKLANDGAVGATINDSVPAAMLILPIEFCPQCDMSLGGM